MPSESTIRPVQLLAAVAVVCGAAALTFAAGPAWLAIVMLAAGALTLLIGRGLRTFMLSQLDRTGLLLGVGLGLALPAVWPSHALLSAMAISLGVPLLFGWGISRTLLLVAAVAGAFISQHQGSAMSIEVLLIASGAAIWAARLRDLRVSSIQRIEDERLQLLDAERESLNELKDIDRLKTGFYSSIVEGLRGPLTLMLSPLDSMLSGDVGNFQANQIEYLETVRRNALRVLRLSDDLVDLSHLESGLLRIQTEESSLRGMLQGIVDHAAAAAQSKGVRLGLDGSEGQAPAIIDVEKLERGITHLVSMALRYTGHGGRIDITLEASGDTSEITIRDNGRGLPPDWIDAISGQDHAKKWLPPRSPEGVGLVLAREIVLLHGGEFSIRSRPEVGTTFSIRLPASAAPRPSTQLADSSRENRIRSSAGYRYGGIADEGNAEPVEHAPSESKATKILVVDDNPEILQFTKQLLSTEHAVFVASNGEDGLLLATQELPDVVITDTRMPKLDGAGLIKAMRADPRLASVPAIILTARNQVADREAARESGADLVMDKPFNPRELRTAIQDLFAKQHRQASNFMNEQARSFEIISAGLAHEMHNPLAYIKNANFVIGENAKKVIAAAEDSSLSPEQRTVVFEKAKDKIDKMLPVSDRGIKKVEQLVALMRRYAREGYSSDAVDMRIDESIADVLSMIAPKDNKEVSIEPDLAAPDAIIKGVPEELQQAITNLTQNAVDAVDKGGHVWVRTRPEARSVRIEVVDDGPGIPRDALARIFTPFFTTKAVGKGMGLGLTITRQVIKQHGGTLEVDSTPGQGTTFTIRIPLASELLQAGDEKSALEQAASADISQPEGDAHL